LGDNPDVLIEKVIRMMIRTAGPIADGWDLSTKSHNNFGEDKKINKQILLRQEENFRHWA
jgi:hypothetical protein